MEPQSETPEVAVVDPAGPPPDAAAPPPLGDLPLTPPPPGRVSQSELDEYDRTTVRLINDKQAELDAAFREFETINSEAKALKTKHQGAVESLQALIRERQVARGKPVQRTLLDVAAEAHAEGTVPAAVEGPANERLENLWREYPLDRLTIHGATPKDIEKLNAGVRKGGGETRPLRTMGQMADYTANAGGSPGYEQRLSDFLGIGPGGLTRICDAENLFWKHWNAGGREEFARELGVITDAPDAGTGSGAAGEGGDGDAPGQPGAAGGADPARDAEARVYPREEGVAAAAGEIDLAWADDAA